MKNIKEYLTFTKYNTLKSQDARNKPEQSIIVAKESRRKARYLVKQSMRGDIYAIRSNNNS